MSEEFSARWDFHNALGALAGKHIAIRCPSPGSLNFNYKGFYSIVLLAQVDANYKFLYVDVGANGNSSNGVVSFFQLLRHCSLIWRLAIFPVVKKYGLQIGYKMGHKMKTGGYFC